MKQRCEQYPLETGESIVPASNRRIHCVQQQPGTLALGASRTSSSPRRCFRETELRWLRGFDQDVAEESVRRLPIVTPPCITTAFGRRAAICIVLPSCRPYWLAICTTV